MSAPDSNKDNDQIVVGEDGNVIQNPPIGNDQDDIEVENVDPVVVPPDNIMECVRDEESTDKEKPDDQGKDSMEKPIENIQVDESMDKDSVKIQDEESMDKKAVEVQDDESMDKEVVKVQDDASNDSEVTANLGLARAKMLNLELGSQEDLTGSTRSTAGTDKTPTLSTQSISPDGVSGSSGSLDSKFPDSSVCTTPLDSPQMVQAVLARMTDSPVPSESSATALLTQKAALASGSDSSPSPTVESGDLLTGKKQKGAVSIKVNDSSPDVPQGETPVDPKHPVRTVAKKVSTPASTPGSKSSPGGSVEPSRQSSLEKTDSSSMSPSGSRDTETDNADADVSSTSPMSADNKKKVYSHYKPQQGPTLSEIMDDFFEPPSLSPVQVQQDRADTLDDADTLAYDTQSVRSSVPERGASVIFPSGKSYPIPPDRDRRAISLPAGPGEKVEKPPIAQRRAISEAPNDSLSNPDLPPPSESPDVSLPVSPDRERRAVSLPPGRDENISRDVRDQRRALSEVPEVSRLTDLPPSASPDDVPLPSPLVSSSSSSSQHVSDVSLDTSKDKSGDFKNGKSRSTDSSLPTEEVDAMMPDLQGWLTRGDFKDNRHLTAGQPGPSRVTEPPSAQPVPAEEIKARLEESSSREESTSNLSSLSEVSSSDIGGLLPWLKKGDYSDNRHLTTGKTSVVSVKPGTSTVKESSKTQPTPGSSLTVPEEVMEGSPSSSEMQVDVEETKEKDPKQSAGSSKEAQTQTRSSRKFPRQAKTKTGVQRTPKRKRDSKPSAKDSADAGSSSSDPKSNVPVSPEEDMASKKYCSEFNRPFTRQLARSNSTGSVRDAYLKKLGLKESKTDSKESSEKEKESDDESSDDEV